MAGYIGSIPVPQATQTRETFTATANQTNFATGGYTPNFIDVFMNGAKLAPADFTATNGSDVVLASGAAANDIIDIVAYTAFEVLNQNFTGTTTVAALTATGAISGTDYSAHSYNPRIATLRNFKGTVSNTSTTNDTFTLQFSLELHDFAEEDLTYQIDISEFLTHGS